MFHWKLLGGQIGDFCGYDLRYCYATFDAALNALDDWMLRGFEGEPDGWQKHPASGRTRPNSDHAQESLEWQIP